MKNSRNTKEKGILHFRIFKWDGRYLGICKEMGFVEEAKSIEEVKGKLINGSLAILGAVIKSSHDLEPSLNTSPPLKYFIGYYIAPLLAVLESLRKSSKEDTGFYSFTKPILPENYNVQTV